MPEQRPLSLPATLALCLGAFVGQLVAQGIAVVVLDPPRNAQTAIYAPAYGASLLVGYIALLAGTREVSRVAGLSLALGSPGTGRLARLAAGGFLLMGVAAALVDPLFGGTKAQQRLLDPTGFPGGGRAAIGLTLVAITIGVIGPLAEELFFRGLLFDALGGGAVAVWLTAGLFAAAHGIPAALPVLFLDGLVLGWLRRRSGSIWPGVIAHATNNAAALALAVLT